jgi:hypothetical protein
LNDDARLLRIDAGGEIVERDLENVFSHSLGLPRVVGEGLHVRDEHENFVLVLHGDTVLQRTHIVTEVKFARGAVAG